MTYTEEQNRDMVVKIWEKFSNKLSDHEIKIVRSRVVSGWSLKRALKGFGYIFPHTGADLSFAKEMFISGQLELRPNTKDTPEETKGDSFTPRPKNVV